MLILLEPALFPVLVPMTEVVEGVGHRCLSPLQDGALVLVGENVQILTLAANANLLLRECEVVVDLEVRVVHPVDDDVGGGFTASGPCGCRRSN